MGSKKKNSKSGAEYRHKRRVRSVAFAYIFVFILVAGIGAGGYLGVRTLANKLTDRKVAKEAEAAAAEAAEEAAKEAEIAAVLAEQEEAKAAEEEAEAAEEEEYTETDLLEEVVQACIKDMSVEDKVAGLFIVTPEQLTGTDKVTKAGDGTKEALDKYPVGGIIYSGTNVNDADQLKEMLDNTISFSKYPLFLAINEGMGSESQLTKPLKLDATKSAKELGDSGDANLTYESYRILGQTLNSYGFNLDFSPLADIAIEGVDSPLADNMFTGDVNLAINLVASSVEGLKENNVSSAVANFPGQGSVDGDTSKGMASTSRTLDDYKMNDIAVFQAAVDAGADMITVGHFAAPELTGDETTPCSLSKEVITDLLRGEYQYDGVVITDALNKKAITEYYGSGEAAVKALKSGADMILMPENFQEAYAEVLQAVADGNISEQRIDDSLARVYRIKYRSTIEE